MNKLVLITGGSASGKTYLADELKKAFGDKIVRISQDYFYKPGGDHNRNYDEPNAFDFEKQSDVIRKLMNGESAELPIYDFAKHDVVGTKPIEPASIIILEGLFAFLGKTGEQADFKIFVDTPSDTRLSRRIIRDVKERGRDIESIIGRWMKDVQPSYKKYIALEKHDADIVIPWVKINQKSIHSLGATISQLGKSLDEILNNK